MLLLALLLPLIGIAQCNAVKLQSFNIDPELITISGLSSGAIMTMQYHLAFSGDVKGAGILAGIPYGCANHSLESLQRCANETEYTDVQGLISFIKEHAIKGDIDPTTNLRGQKVFIYHGALDHRINPKNAELIKAIYDGFGSLVKVDTSVKAAHGFPTSNYGGLCSQYSPETQYINNCNPYNGVYQTLSHLYDGIIFPDPSASSLGSLVEFDQTEFGSEAAGMDPSGFLYVPQSCENSLKPCKLHISLHGCQQYKGAVGRIYAEKTGYLEIAEVNEMIVVFPQIRKTEENPNGCWDWWGYQDNNYLFKTGAQMQAVNKIMSRLAFKGPKIAKEL